MAARGRCTPPRWRASCRSARSSSRARPGTSRPTACWSPTCAATSSTPGSRRSPTRRFRRWKRSSPRWSAQGRATVGARPDARRASRCGAPPTCATSARSTPSPSSCRSSCSRAQDRDGIKQRFDAVHQTRYGFSVAGEKAEIVSLRSAVDRRDAQAAVRAHRQGRRGARRRGVPRQAAGVFRRHRLRRHADLRPRRAQGRQQDRRPGADRGACLDHGRASRATSSRSTRSAISSSRFGEADDGRRRRKPKRKTAATIRSSPKSCATASSP